METPDSNTAPPRHSFLPSRVEHLTINDGTFTQVVGDYNIHTCADTFLHKHSPRAEVVQVRRDHVIHGDVHLHIHHYNVAPANNPQASPPSLINWLRRAMRYLFF